MSAALQTIYSSYGYIGLKEDFVVIENYDFNLNRFVKVITGSHKFNIKVILQ